MNFSLLRISSILYLLIPNIIFVNGWFRWQYAVPVTAGFVYLFWCEIKKKPGYLSGNLGLNNTLLIGVFTLIWTALTGIGGLFPQSSDFWAHHSKFYDLFKNPWPIFFEEKGRYACYYFGYYLIPALVSKLLSQLSVPAIFLWTWLGLGLGIAWVFLLIGKNKFLLFVFPFLGGFCLLAVKILNLLFGSFDDLFYFLTMWSLYDQSLWVPNQVIPILIVSGIVVYDCFYNNKIYDSFFPITLCFIWAIFPSIIMVFLYGLTLIFSKFKDILHFSSLRTLILPGLLFIPSFLYLLSSDSMPAKGFVWEVQSWHEIARSYTGGVLLEAIILFVLTILIRRYVPDIPLWFISGTYLLFIPLVFYRIGVNGDSLSRGSIPVLVLISIMLLAAVSNFFTQYREIRPRRYYALVFLFLLSFSLPFLGLSRLENPIVHNKFLQKLSPGTFSGYTTIPYDRFSNAYQMLLSQYSEAEARQYLGKKNSLFEKYLVK